METTSPFAQMQAVAHEKAEALMNPPAEDSLSVSDILAEVVFTADAAATPESLAEKAVEALESKLGSAAFARLSGTVMAQWVAERIRYARHDARCAIVESNGAATASSTQQQNPDRTAGALSLMYRSWLDWPLSGGVRLSSAKRPQLLSEAERYRKVAKTSQCRGAWLAAIAEALPDDAATVGRAMTEKQVAALAKRHGVVDQAEEV